MSEKLQQLAEQIRSTVQEPWPREEYKKIIIEKHRYQWPELWEQIDNLIEYLDDQCLLSNQK